MLTVEEFEPCFDQYVDVNFQKEIVKAIIRGYFNLNKSIKSCEFAPIPEKNVYPYNRWAAIDTTLLALSGKYRDFEIISKANSRRNSYYTLISSPFINMTVSSVNSPKSVPREAKFRSDYASIQTTFIPVDDVFKIMPPESCSKKLYAIILHGVIDKSNPYMPSFIRLGFPADDCKSYITTVDLCEKYKDVVQEMLHEGTENIPDKALPGLIAEREKQEPTK